MPRQAEETFEYDDFLSWTVTSLKDFLALRGLKQTGTKAELVARAFGAYELNAPKKFSQEEIYTSMTMALKDSSHVACLSRVTTHTLLPLLMEYLHAGVVALQQLK